MSPSTPEAFAGLTLDRPRLMGIVNATPDSFSDGGHHATADAAIDHALRLEDEGADILDIGGESTRPGAEPVAPDEEIRRVAPVIERLAARASARLSVDTRNADVMSAALDAGAHIVNDVSALTHDPASLELVARRDVPVILMHAQGDPRTMQNDPQYDDVVADVAAYLAARREVCVNAGIARGHIALDPGIGFGKTMAHNLALISGVDAICGLGSAVLLGASRKGFIGHLSGVAEAHERVNGSVAAALAGVMRGVQLIRVHDVSATREALAVWQAIADARPPAATR
ncbi:MAG: dihydropteroate synthase [Pseudomonadota bacterium]